MRLGLAAVLILSGSLLAQDRELSKPNSAKNDPKYDETFSGSIIELSTWKVGVSRSILGKKPEKRTFTITTDTRIEGKLRLHAKVTIGFVVSDDGDVARLIVVRQKPPDKPAEKK